MRFYTSPVFKLLLLFISLWSFAHPVAAAECNSVGASPDVTVTVHVADTDGNPVANALIKLEDHGPPRLTESDKTGRTSETGCLVFNKGTGPPPCNTFKLLLPNRPDVEAVETGCFNVGEFEHTFTVSSGGSGGGSDCTVVDTTRDEWWRCAYGLVEVDVFVKDSSGVPIENERIKLEDREGWSPDDRYAHTSAAGCVKFLETTGCDPCNEITILLPDRPNQPSEYLGCLTQAEKTHTFTISPSGGGECNSVGASPDVTVAVHVADTDGNPVANELIKLEDHGPPRLTESDKTGRTSDTGCLVFNKGTGPPPCNTFKLLLPNRPDVEAVETGCFNVGEFEHTFTVSSGGSGGAEEGEEDDLGPGSDVLKGLAIGVPVGIVVLALIVGAILFAIRRRRHGLLPPLEQPNSVSSENSEDNFSMTDYSFFGSRYTTSAAQPPQHQPQIPSAPPLPRSPPPHMPPSILNPACVWPFKDGHFPAESNDIQAEVAMTGAVPWVARSAQGEVRPAQHRREDLDSETREQCLVCLDGPRQYGFLHSGTVHLGVCASCLPAVQRQRVSECMVCRSRIQQIIRVH